MSVEIITGDARNIETMGEASVDCCVTSPPYWGLRDYGVDRQIGLEKTPQEYAENIVAVFREVRRALREDGTLWLNLGDCYATGAGKVGDCPGGGKDGERWKKVFGKNAHAGSTAAAGLTSPNRMPIPGLKPKDLVGIPWRVAFALQADGWYLRSDIIWSKPNPMPESVTDRPTKAHEYIFLLSKSKRYYYDTEAIAEPQSESERRRRLLEADKGANGKYTMRRDGQTGARAPSESGACRNREGRQALAKKGTRNKRSVWTVPTRPYTGAHFAVFPPDLIRPCILAGCRPGGTVLDPFAGSGTTGVVAEEEGRNSVLIELNPDYIEIIRARTAQRGLFT